MRRRLKEEYDQHLECLSIFITQPDLSDINESLAEKDKELKDLKHEMKIMRRQMNILKPLSKIFENSSI